MAKPTAKPAPLDPLDRYARVPSSKVGEHGRAQAQVADLHQRGSTETRRKGEGVAAK